MLLTERFLNQRLKLYIIEILELKDSMNEMNAIESIYNNVDRVEVPINYLEDMNG